MSAGLMMLGVGSALGLSACGSSSVPRVAAASCAWHAERSGEATNDLYGLSFPDDQHGWAVGGIDRPVIRVTTDGGRVWRGQPASGTNGLSSVSFPDDTHGWAVGVHNSLFVTTDGGRHWRPGKVPVGHDGNLYGVFFLDDRHGWIVGSNGVILATANGGGTWQAQRSGTHSDLATVSFVNRDDGSINTDNSVLLHTTNGGATWAPAFSASSQHSQILAGDFFLGTQRGWTAGSQDDAQAHHGVISRTTDGGRTWTREDVKYFDDVRFTAVTFTDDEHGWMTGTEGELWYSDDGGENWAPRRDPRIGDRLYAMQFRNATHGWAVGEQGTIVACTARHRS
jgi:photosystem II stability/assembly factor-like uncharacterized protein